MAWLYLLRHGVVDEEGEDPPLSREGIARMRGEAKAMVRLGFRFDAVFASPLQRAVQTAAIVAEASGTADRVRILDALAPGCRLSALSVLEGAVDPGARTQSALLVGHAPDMGAIAGELMGAAGALPMRRGMLCCVELFAWPPAPPGRLRFLMPPDLLLAVARERSES